MSIFVWFLPLRTFHSLISVRLWVLWFICFLNLVVQYEPEVTACQTNPCGINAVCKERDNAGSCTCLPEYYGDPYFECRPECVMNSDCPMAKACVNMKCIDPCVGVCGANAECFVANHSPYCSCFCGYTGNPSVGCYEIPKRMCFACILSDFVGFECFWLMWFVCHRLVPEPEVHLCHPSPCGPYSQCRELDNRAICSCIENYIGSPPACRPECTINSECFLDKACVNHKCVDPCASSICGDQARCQAINHNPICSCPLGYNGDPFVRCTPQESKLSAHFTHLHSVWGVLNRLQSTISWLVSHF